MKTIIFICFFYLIHIFEGFFSQSALGDKCNSNLDCTSTVCCRDGKCVDFDVCKSSMINSYIAIGVVGAGLILITMIYFIVAVKQTRKNVRAIREKMKEEEAISKK